MTDTPNPFEPSAGATPEPTGTPLPPSSSPGEIPLLDYVPPPAPKRKVAPVGVAIATVVALLAGGFAFAALRSSSGGASSPEAAVQHLFDALDKEDAIGVLETLEPGERDLFLPTVQHLTDELTRLGIVKGVDLKAVPGVDLKVEGLTLAPEPVYDGVTRVDITGGTITTTVKPEAVPIGDVLKDLITGFGGDPTVQAKTDTSPINSDGNASIVAVKDGDGWYVSLFFSAAESMRKDAGLAPPDPAKAVVPTGADSPEAAVTELFGGVSALDLRRMIAILDPHEARALQLYAPLFLEDAQNSLDDGRSQAGLGLTIDNLKLATVDGTLGKLVQINGIRIKVDMQGSALSLEIGDGCVNFDATGAAAQAFNRLLPKKKYCTGDEAATPQGLPPQVAQTLEEFQKAARELATTIHKVPTGLLVAQRNGKWFVSPVGNLSEVVIDVLKSLDRSALAKDGPLYNLAHVFAGLVGTNARQSISGQGIPLQSGSEGDYGYSSESNSAEPSSGG